MPRRLRPPVGAWYWGYAGLPPETYYNGFQPDPPTTTTTSKSVPNESFERDVMMYGDPGNAKRTRSPMVLSQDERVYRHAAQHYTPDKRRSWDVAKGDAYYKTPRNAMPYNNHHNHHHNNPGDFRPYDPPAHRHPQDDFKYYDPQPRNGPPGGAVVEYRPYISSPRAGLWDGKQYETARYNGAADREREVHGGRYSPRKMVYEPSFHDPAATPRNIPPWEREMAYQRSPYYGEGRDRPEPPRDDRPEPPREDRPEPPRGERPEPPRSDRLQPAQREDATVDKVAKQPKQKMQTHSVFLFLRFNADDRAVVGQACQAAVTKDLRGEFVGITEGMAYQVGKTERGGKGYAVFLLPSLDSAQVFYNRYNRIRQPDFPHSASNLDIFALNLRTSLPTSQEYSTYLLTEISLGTKEDHSVNLTQYEEEFAKPFARLLYEQGAIPYVAFTDGKNRKVMKGHPFDSKDILTLHLFQDTKDYLALMSHPEFKRLDARLAEFAVCKSYVFTLSPQCCP